MKCIERIKNNWNIFIKFYLKRVSSLFALLSAVLLLIDKEEMGIDSNCIALWIYAGIVIGALILSIVQVLFYKENQIYSSGASKLILRYDDIWKIAFTKKKCWEKDKKKIVVVSVNTSFDTIVDEDISKVRKPLVSSTTLHGQWINQMRAHGVDINEIDKGIHDSLVLQNIKPSSELERSYKERGKLECYEKGTIAVYKYDNTFFYLLALSEFDEENKAQNTRNELIRTVEKMIEYYDANGQGYDLFVPLLGTGRSRTDISMDDALQIIVSYFKIYKARVKGKVKIIIYKKQRDQVSLDV